MELLLAFVIASLVMKTSLVGGYNDVAAIRRGEVAPSHARSVKRMDLLGQVWSGRKTGTGQKVSRPRAARAYAGTLWRDSWEIVNARHVRRHAKRMDRLSSAPKTGAMAGWFGEVKADAWEKWDRSWKKKAEQRADRRKRQDQTEQPDSDPTDETGQGPDLGPGSKTDPEDSAETGPETGQPDSPGPDLETGPGEVPGLTPPTDPDELANWKKAWWAIPAAGAGVAAKAVLTATRAADEKEGTAQMSDTVSGEVTGLQTAIAFCEALAAQARSAPPSLDQLSAGLAAGGTEGEALTNLAAAADKANAMVADLENAVAVLKQHLQVKEAYESTGNEAGTKEFVTSE